MNSSNINYYISPLLIYNLPRTLYPILGNYLNQLNQQMEMEKNLMRVLLMILLIQSLRKQGKLKLTHQRTAQVTQILQKQVPKTLKR